MKAMVLAAGLGTRLRPLTETLPKALVTLDGRTLIDITLQRLAAADVSEVIVNVHHHAEMMSRYLQSNRNFGMRIEISREDELLDTGGGLKKTAWFFLEGASGVDEPGRGGSGGGEPFLVHNVDVISGIDLGAMVRFHREHGALATLAVQSRDTSRPLVFDGEGQLRGRGRPGGEVRDGHARAFAGIHVVSPRIFAKLSEEGAFSIIDAYVRLAGEGERIVGFDADGAYWRDLGRLEDLRRAEGELRNRPTPGG